MTAAQFEQLGELEVETVLRWRFEALIRVGYDAGEAMVLASHVEVDLHTATDLIARGCSTSTAMQILL